MSKGSDSEKLTIIVPVYNEAPCLKHFQGEMDRFLSQSPMDTTVLFVNDGSTDDSQAMIETICTA
ncbi:MAG: dolichol-phosphate mannosyltransferase, partial [Deltaproteobacteria bacterium]